MQAPPVKAAKAVKPDKPAPAFTFPDDEDAVRQAVRYVLKVTHGAG